MSGTGITVQPGWQIYGTDGSKIGTVREVGNSFFRMRTGGILAKDLFVPMSAIEDLDEAQTQVNLNVSKSDVGRMGWDRQPDEPSVPARAMTSRPDERDADSGEPALRDRGSTLRTPAGIGADTMNRADDEHGGFSVGTRGEDDTRDA